MYGNAQILNDLSFSSYSFSSTLSYYLASFTLREGIVSDIRVRRLLLHQSHRCTMCRYLIASLSPIHRLRE